jgi:integrase
VRIELRHSKTDQEGQGMLKGIPYGHDPETCPVRAWQAWQAAAGLTGGAAFRSVTRHGRIGASLSDKAVALVVKRRALAAGLDPALFSGHSLRAGLATAAAQAGVPERSIMDQTGHKSLPVLRGYIREGSLFGENAAAKVGL